MSQLPPRSIVAGVCWFGTYPPEDWSLGEFEVESYGKSRQLVVWPPSTWGPYGHCPCAQPYDDACGEWASTGGSIEALRKAREYQRHSTWQVTPSGGAVCMSEEAGSMISRPSKLMLIALMQTYMEAKMKKNDIIWWMKWMKWGFASFSKDKVPCPVASRDWSLCRASYAPARGVERFWPMHIRPTMAWDSAGGLPFKLWKQIKMLLTRLLPLQ